MKKILNKIKNKEGFTIIETLVAITILMIAIAGPMTIAQKGLRASVQARDQITATYLAQDVMEYMKNLRDKNYTQSSSRWGWMYGLDGNGGLASKCTRYKPCVVESSGAGYVFETDSDSDLDLYAPTTGLYQPNPNVQTSVSPIATVGTTNQKTIFTRKFFVDTNNISNGQDEATFVVEVDWHYDDIPNVVKIQAQVFNIRL